jgi:CRP/FNR family transcriptional regulator, cyclic AMP receptor protein
MHVTRALQNRSAPISVDALLADSAWFGQVSEAAQRQVRADLVERAISAGEPLGYQGESQHHWYGVLEGLLKWSINAPDGRTATLGGQSAGSWFGEGTLLRGQPRRAELVALRHSRVAMLPFETFDWLRRTEGPFNEFLLHQINERLHWFMGNYAAHHLLDTDRLVARAVVGLVHPLLNPRGERHLTLSQEELAHLAAVSRQRCNQSLMAMKREGLVQVAYGAIVVIDLEALQRRAG